MPKKSTFDPKSENGKEKIEFSNVTIINDTPVMPKGKREYHFLVKCNNCGKEYLKAKWTFGKYRCQCYKTINGAYNYQGYKDISASYFRRVKSNAKQVGREFTITKQSIWEQWKKQDGKCALSGIKIKIERNYTKIKGMTASLDRINSSKGYTNDNVQWIHKDINRMKSNFDEKYFIKICKLISKNNK
jgi:hypothetical protein